MMVWPVSIAKGVAEGVLTARIGFTIITFELPVAGAWVESPL